MQVNKIIRQQDVRANFSAKCRVNHTRIILLNRIIAPWGGWSEAMSCP